MSSGDIKGFYRQKKKGGVAKPSTSTSTSTSKKSKQSTLATTHGGASVGVFDASQPAALVTRGGGALDLKGEFGDEEEALRQFDMDMRYGPCIGVDRLERWERAAAMGLHPPSRVRELLAAPPSTGNLQCLWEGRA